MITVLLNDLPNRNQAQIDFDRSYAKLMTDLPQWGSEVNATAADVRARAAQAVAAAATAATQAQAAVAAINAVAWAPGNYAVGVTRYSPMDGRTYRCYVAASGSVDPALDPGRWVCISAAPRPYLHVQDQKPSGTGGGFVNSFEQLYERALNTTVGINSIVGASLSGNRVTLPAGVYDIYATAPAGAKYAGGPIGSGSHRLLLYDTTLSTPLLIGSAVNPGENGLRIFGSSVISGKISLSATRQIYLQHWIGGGIAGQLDSLGGPVRVQSQPEVYASLQIWRDF